MSNILDYIDWRGDLTVKQAPFNEVDSLILTQLSFMDLSGIAEGATLRHSVSLREAVVQVLNRSRDRQPEVGVFMSKELPALYRKAASSKRFGDMRLFRYSAELDEEKETQFAAFCVAVGDGSTYIVFRGTDDNIVGWKEDLNMMYMDEIPAQSLARAYVADAAKHLHGRLRIGGHSKGGNLAIFSATHQPTRLQNRIIAVYNNDGPGFGTRIAELAAYAGIADKVYTVVPHFSVIGLLLEHSKIDKVVRSTGEGLWQHDPCTWQVQGDRFVSAGRVSQDSLRVERTIRGWLAELSPEQRKDVVEAVYKAVTASGAKTLTDIATDKLDFVRSLGKLDAKTRDVVLATGKLLVREGMRTRTVESNRKKEKKK